MSTTANSMTTTSTGQVLEVLRSNQILGMQPLVLCVRVGCGAGGVAAAPFL